MARYAQLKQMFLLFLSMRSLLRKAILCFIMKDMKEESFVCHQASQPASQPVCLFVRSFVRSSSESLWLATKCAIKFRLTFCRVLIGGVVSLAAGPEMSESQKRQASLERST